MIDPKNITKYNQTTAELEEFILFWVCAAGKNAQSAAKGLDNFLSFSKVSPFEHIKNFHRVYNSSLGVLGFCLKHCGIGCYNQKARTFWELANSGLDLHTCSAQELETITGIGMKTSRCFILHSRQNAQYAGLDVHILRYLGDLGYDVPKQTPAKKKYLQLEEIFLSIAKEKGLSPADLDLMIWKTYSSKTKEKI
jgi:thermostable 8-oxoguanine DNA glycosylase